MIMVGEEQNKIDDIQLNDHKHPHYHLKLNKAIDRLLFIDVIKAFSMNVNIYEQKHRYIGFGGPYLEDFRLLSGLFPEMKLISLEKERDTFKRQKFHKCSKNLKLINCSFDVFLDETELFDKYPVIIWLDYTDDAPKIKHLREIEALCKKINKQSLIRVTLDANSCPGKDFKHIYEEYLPTGINEQTLAREHSFAELVCQMIKKAIYKGLESDDLTFLPLHQARYRDGHHMVSLTGMICEDENDEWLEKMRGLCPYVNNEQEVDIIDIPAFTLKERLHIENCLPNKNKDGSAIAKKLNYMIGRDEEDNLRKCEQYEKYYPYYPYFNKIIP